MKKVKKVAWLIVSCLMILSLVLASCGTTEPEEEVIVPGEEETAGKEKLTLEKADGTVIEKWVEKPEYGGELNMAYRQTLGHFDPTAAAGYSDTYALTNDKLVTGDWAKGQDGTNEMSWFYGLYRSGAVVGMLAESWEVPDDETVIYHIRQGCYWQDKPPLNGREFTAYDAAFTYYRDYIVQPTYVTKLIRPKQMWPVSVEATDKWTLVIKYNPGWAMPGLNDLAQFSWMVAPEPYEKYGDDKLTDWQDIVGTGPFILEDHVPGSSATLVKNPNYWRKNPLFPDQTLPYVDAVNIYIIKDKATRMAALRTGKVDMMDAKEVLTLEDNEGLLETTPELQWVGRPNRLPYLVGMRGDVEPLDDYSVRLALAMAIDREAIVNDYYKGAADMFSWPVMNRPEWQAAYRPLEEFPESIQEQFEYNPEKAKQLLEEAGYPDGFKTKILAAVTKAEELQIVAAYWKEIGVDLEFNFQEPAAYNSLLRGGDYDQMVYLSYMASYPENFATGITGAFANIAHVYDPEVEAWYADVQKHTPDWEYQAEIIKEKFAPYEMGGCWYIQFPTSYLYQQWWPWVKGYHGEEQVGMGEYYNWVTYLWIDQELKESMGY